MFVSQYLKAAAKLFTGCEGPKSFFGNIGGIDSAEGRGACDWRLKGLQTGLEQLALGK